MDRLKALICVLALAGCTESTTPEVDFGDVDAGVDTGGGDTGPSMDAGAPDAGPSADAAAADVPPPPDAAGGMDAGGTDVGPGPSPNIDPRPVTESEAECAGLTAPECAGCHVYEGRWYLIPYWAPPPPADIEPIAPAPGCVLPPRTNALSDEAIECFGLADPACVACHTGGDGNIYLRPWGNVPPPPPDIAPADPGCYDLL